jgi:hypothetical protein
MDDIRLELAKAPSNSQDRPQFDNWRLTCTCEGDVNHVDTKLPNLVEITGGRAHHRHICALNDEPLQQVAPVEKHRPIDNPYEKNALAGKRARHRGHR